jgi:hypothetical protein
MTRGPNRRGPRGFAALRAGGAYGGVGDDSYPPPKSGAQKLRRPSRWRPLEQGLWRRPLSVWQNDSGGSGCAG